jgi:arylsulfatase A-like enzyme
MTERSPLRRALPLAGLAWMALAALETLLQTFPPKGVAADGSLPFWVRGAFLSVEAFALAIGVAIASLPLAGLSSAISQAAPSRGRWLRIARVGLLALLFLGLSSDWALFLSGGQFFDSRTLPFAAGNLRAIWRYEIAKHPVLLVSSPFLILLAAIFASELLPGWIQSRSPRTLGAIERTAIGLVALLLLGSAVGEIGLACSERSVERPLPPPVFEDGEVVIRMADLREPSGADPRTVRAGDLYREQRRRKAGPLTHLVAGWRGTGDLFEDGRPSELFFLYLEKRGLLAAYRNRLALDPLDRDPRPEFPAAIRRPIVPERDYLSSIDRAQIRRWNVVVILIDSLRSDQLVATGGNRDVMPALEELAREGAVFSNCLTQASHTSYACPAVFSSHYPYRTRTSYAYPREIRYPRTMIYDVLKSLGWRTALFSSQNEEWSQMLNYIQTGNIDVVFYPKPNGVSPIPGARLNPFTGSLDDRLTLAESLKWIENGRPDPFFLYLNLQNSHLPFEMPDDFPRRFSPAKLDFQITASTFPKEKAAVAKGVYSDSLSYVDSLLAEFFRRLRELGEWDRTLVVVSGDHGESFYEHGLAAHANGVFEEVIRVPLIFHAPGLSGRREGRPVELIDIAPGVFHLLGLPIHPGFQGRNPLAGELRPDRVRFSVCQTSYRTQLCVTRGGFKLIREGHNGAATLYDLANDPQERVDVSAKHPAVAQDLRAWLAAWRWAQLDYWADEARQALEYPPILREP